MLVFLLPHAYLEALDRQASLLSDSQSVKWSHGGRGGKGDGGRSGGRVGPGSPSAGSSLGHLPSQQQAAHFTAQETEAPARLGPWAEPP